VPAEKDLRFDFPSFYRLRKSNEIKLLFSEGKRIETKHFILYYKKNLLPYPRIAIVTSKKVGKAVFRNRLRRYVREIFRTNKELFDNNDHVFIFKRKRNKLPYSDIYDDIKKVMTDVKKR
jgi:ribonuclease P protein component